MQDHKDKIECYTCPASYSPELNPEEQLNADLKLGHRQKIPVGT
jgi:hypothetical protein